MITSGINFLDLLNIQIPDDGTLSPAIPGIFKQAIANDKIEVLQNMRVGNTYYRSRPCLSSRLSSNGKALTLYTINAIYPDNPQTIQAVVIQIRDDDTLIAKKVEYASVPTYSASDAGKSLKVAANGKSLEWA